MFGFSIINVLLYFVYPVSLISISMYVSRNKEVSVESYFFANRNMTWLVSGVSLLTTCFFSPYIFSFSSSGLNASLPIVYGLVSSIMLVVLGWVIAPLYSKLKINTLPEYFEKRFGGSSKFFLSALYILSNIVFRLLPVLAIGGALLQEVAGVDTYSILLFFLVVTGLYVLIGGLEAEAYVNIVQVLFISLGAGVFSWWMFSRGDVAQSFEMNSFFANSEFTAAGLFFGLPIIGFWFWSADQFVVQKILSVQNNSSVKKAVITSLFLQIIPVLLFVLPGVLLFTLSENQSSAVTLHTLFSGGAIPESLRGGITVGAVAALMATFANLFNSTSSLVTFDFYRSLKRNASDRELVLVGRMTTMILLFVSILLIPFSQTISFESCLTLVKIFAYFASMVAAVFLTSLINKKINAACAIITFCASTVLISFRSIAELFFGGYTFESTMIQWFVEIGFLEFSVFVFLFSMLFVLSIHKLRMAAVSSFLSKKQKTVF